MTSNTRRNWPSNLCIRATTRSSSSIPPGTPKLLDFGIAKVLDANPPTGQVTQTAVRMMTPDYASPEQVRGAAITIATDVYSLGAILYEVLCDQPAHRFKDYSSTEIERVVCVNEPLAPSAA